MSDLLVEKSGFTRERAGGGGKGSRLILAAFCWVVFGCATVTVGPNPLPKAKVGKLYKQDLEVECGTEPLQFVLQSGLLPAGITLKKRETKGGPDVFFFSGRPKRTGTFHFTFQISCRPTMFAGDEDDVSLELVVER